jgi:Holliday junction resolvase-like predicted endonuclease
VNENEINESVCRHLVSTGWQVLSRCSTTEQGIDIVAKRNEQDCFIESKGGTSSREGSARYGKPYTESQVFDRVSKGFYTAACLRSEKSKQAVIGLALPDTKYFRKYAAKVSRSAKALRISIYWVLPNKSVQTDE